MKRIIYISIVLALSAFMKAALGQDIDNNLVLGEHLVLPGTNENYQAENTITTTDSGNGFLVSDSASCNMLSGSRITLGKGFSAKKGSFFHADLGQATDTSALYKSLNVVRIITEEDSIVKKNRLMSDIEITLSPNPTKGLCTLSINKDVDRGDVRLIDTNGNILNQIHLQGNGAQIDLSAFAKGVYFIEVAINEQVFVGKIVLE